MLKKIKNFHLFILVVTVFFLNLLLIKEIVLAQWLGPTNPPGYEDSPNILTSPLSENLQLGEFGIIGDGKDESRRINFDRIINLENGYYEIKDNYVIGWDGTNSHVKIPQDLEVGGNINIVDDGELLLSGEAYIKASALNTFIGINTGENNNNNLAISNTFVGTNAGWQNVSGDSNTFVGFFAGAYSTWGEGNTFLGYRAGVGDGAPSCDAV